MVPATERKQKPRKYSREATEDGVSWWQLWRTIGLVIISYSCVLKN